MFQNHPETAGERAIKAELDNLKISYEQEKQILRLKGDTKSFRVADFYLPDYDCYIEFLGNWDTNEEHKKRYRHKKIIYEKNNIKCLYIYPKSLYKANFIIERYIEKLQEEHEKEISKKRKPNYENQVKVSNILIIIGLILIVIPEFSSTILGIILLITGIILKFYER